jgi:dipeptidase D
VRHNPQAGWKSFDVGIKGLLGGHTGIDIHKPRGNAIKLLAEILQQWNRERGGLQIASFEGGAALNTIPRAASARVVLSSEQEATAFKASVTAAYDIVRAQYKLAEPQMEFTLSPNAQPLADKAVCDPATSAKLLDVLLVLPHGVHRVHPDIEHEVESSISFSKIVLDARTASFFFFGRSSSESQMQRSLEQLQAFARLAGLGTSGRHNSFPAWQPDTQSRTLRILQRLANLQWPNGVRVSSVHAGLECGWVLGKYPSMDCVSIGPQIDNAHTPDERLLIPSVPRFWTLLTNTLAAIGKELQA